MQAASTEIKDAATRANAAESKHAEYKGKYMGLATKFNIAQAGYQQLSKDVRMAEEKV
jgi:hypothetical protein